MKYINAQHLLPESLLHSIQQYIQGNYLYIPIQQEHKKEWGERSGYKQMLKGRNAEILRAFQSGVPAQVLAEQYYLSERSIRRILTQERAGRD